MNDLQWLEERRKGIGGSDVAAIMGLSPWKTAYQVYQEKRKEVKDWQGNDATDWGKRQEPVIRRWYSDFTGRSVRLPDKIIFNNQYPFMLASLDGFTDDPRGVEIKTARSGREWGEPGTDEIPFHYLLQVQHYMVVTGFPVFDVAVSIGGTSPVLYSVSDDKGLGEMIIGACAEFWQRVIHGNPPPPESYADAVQRYGLSTAQGNVQASEDALKDYHALLEVRKEKVAIEDEEERLKGQLIIALGDSGDTLINGDGYPIVTYKMGQGRTTFDVKALEKADPETYKKYLRTGESTRRFLLK